MGWCFILDSYGAEESTKQPKTGGRGGGSVGSDVTLRQNWSVFIRCRTMAVGAALAL